MKYKYGDAKMVLEKITTTVGRTAVNIGNTVSDFMDTTQDAIDDVTSLRPVHGAIGLVTGIVDDIADAVKREVEIVRELRR